MFPRSLRVPAAGMLLLSVIFSGCGEDDAADTPITCDELSCEAEQRTCSENGETADATCGACLDGYEEVNGACEASDACATGYRDHGEGRELIFTQISAGGNHTCAIAQGELYCWGDNGSGQLGSGDRISQSAPIQVGDLNTWDRVSAGFAHTCAITQGPSGNLASATPPNASHPPGWSSPEEPGWSPPTPTAACNNALPTYNATIPLPWRGVPEGRGGPRPGESQETLRD